jgi:deoxyribonuclease V
VLAAVDVDYRAEGAVAACVLFATWDAARPSETLIERVAAFAPYQPGELYRRELPCLLAVLARAPALEVVCVDGHAWVGVDRPGLGAHLHRAIGRPVIGVAKRAFVGAPARALCRGESRRPLWISTAGHDLDDAIARVASMHGAHRLPTLFKLVDRLCRSA